MSKTIRKEKKSKPKKRLLKEKKIKNFKDFVNEELLEEEPIDFKIKGLK